jgi:hypothetical protein
MVAGGSNAKIGAKLLMCSVGNNEQPLEIIADRQVELEWINGGDSHETTDMSIVCQSKQLLLCSQWAKERQVKNCCPS